jgi:hypothetical protein
VNEKEKSIDLKNTPHWKRVLENPINKAIFDRLKEI